MAGCRPDLKGLGGAPGRERAVHRVCDSVSSRAGARRRLSIGGVDGRVEDVDGFCCLVLYLIQDTPRADRRSRQHFKGQPLAVLGARGAKNSVEGRPKRPTCTQGFLILSIKILGNRVPVAFEHEQLSLGTADTFTIQRPLVCGDYLMLSPSATRCPSNRRDGRRRQPSQRAPGPRQW